MEQLNIFSSAWTTLSRLLAYLTTLGTSTPLAILVPQRQTKTPTLGDSPVTSRSGGYSFSVTNVPRLSERSCADSDAAPLAIVTESGISLGA